jgi:hypothetical protein
MNGQTNEVKTLGTPSGGRPYANPATAWTPDPSVGHLLYTMRHVGPKVPPDVDADYDETEAEEDYEFLEQLLQSRELNALVKAHNVILFCNQEQCPCVSNACQITADVMEDIRPYALMIEECRELYAILSTPHMRVNFRKFF